MKLIAYTRFGLYVEDSEWYEKQLEVFNKYVFRSMNEQTDKSFVWIVGVDEKVPCHVAEKLRATLNSSDLTFYIVVYKREEVGRLPRAGNTEWLYEEALDKIGRRNLFESPKEFYISAMIDADDAWNRNVVAYVKDFFERRLKDVEEKELTVSYLSGMSGSALTFSHGVNFYEQDRTFVKNESNFVSMSIFVLARAYSGVSCHSARHPSWRLLPQVIEFEKHAVYTDEPMWVYSKDTPNAKDKNKLDFSESFDEDSPRFDEIAKMFGLNPREICIGNEDMGFRSHFDPKELQNRFFEERYNYLVKNSYR